MSNYCVIHPRLSNGEKSPLFSRLKQFLGDHKMAEDVYYRTLSPEFKNVFPNVQFDKNNEPLLEDLIMYCGIGHKKNNAEMLYSLNDLYGVKPLPKSMANVTTLQQKAAAYNNKATNTTAVVTSSEEGIGIEIVNSTSSNKDLAKQQKYNAELNTQLINLLNSWGFNVGALTEVEERADINGIMDLSAAERAAEGLKEVIRIAKGERGQTALAEEWGHFVVEAVTETPLKDRILSTLKNDEVLRRVLGEEYDRYNEVYEGDIDLLAKEALGKMMAQVLNNYDVSAPNNALFERYKKVVIDSFKDKNTSEIDNIITNIREMVYEFTTNAFTGKYKLNVENLRYKTKLYNLGNNVNKYHTILENLINKEKKRLKMYGTASTATVGERKKNKGSFDEKQKLFIENLERSLQDHKELEGILSYLKEATDVMKKLGDKVANTAAMRNDRSKFKALRGVRNYMASYVAAMEELRKEALERKKQGDSELWDTTIDALNEYAGLAAGLGSDWIETSKDEFADFLKEFEGEGVSITVRGERKQYTIRELLDYVEKDISIVERWIDAAADSTDPIIRIYDAIVKKQKNKARLKTIEGEKELMMQAKKLEQAGISNTDFMYEVSTRGRITGRFVTKYNWGDYGDDLRAFKNSLSPHLSEEDKQIAVSRWKREHTINDNPIDKYLSKQYIQIQNNKAMKEYYDFVMKMKKNLDYAMPYKYVSYSRAPQIRKDFIERMLHNNNKGRYLWETIKDNFIRREDDTEYAYAKQDFEGNQVHTLPIYYTRKLQDMNDLSMDCTSTMIAYAAMANNYAAMDEVIDALETGIMILNERKIGRTRGGRILSEIIDKVPSVLYKKGDVSNFMARLNDFMLMQVYGEQVKDEGEFLGLDVGKTINLLNKLQSLGTTALSVLTGTANLMQNIVLSNVESVAGQHFGTKELAKADWEYTKLLPEYLGELGNRIKTSKMALFDEMFNVSQSYNQSVKSTDWRRKTWFSRFFKEDTLWFTTSAGDHYTQMRTALALASRMKLMDKDGKEISLLDALEVKYLDEKHPEYGAKLVFKEGVTDSNGNKIGDNYINTVTKKIRGINDKLYGIYNQEDKNAAQSRALGRLAMMYRNWMRPLFLKRFGVEKYNMDTVVFEEGYYRTLFNFTLNLSKDIKKGEFDIIKEWHNLSKGQKSNMWKAIVELAIFSSLTIIVSVLKAVPDDKDKERNWLTSYVNYAIVRLKADLGSLIPGPTMLDEGLRLFDNPFAAIRVLKNIRQLLTLFDPDTWTTEINNGIYKGYTKAEKAIIQPIPFIRQFQNLFDPEEPTRWYK